MGTCKLSVSLYSTGYATRPLTDFLSQLKNNDIDVVADVRSVPYSAAFHDYHREPLQRSLKDHDIRYVYLGKELGPRSEDPDHYDATDQVQFDRLRQSQFFLQGIARLQSGLEKVIASH